MSSKHFINECFNSSPKRYGIDDGDLNIVNDYFTSQGWPTFTREQFAAIASLIRLRNMFLMDNPNYDLRKKKEPPRFLQRTIYDFLDDDTSTQTRNLTRYFAGDEHRLNQSSSRIKKSVRGVDNEHITAVKIMLPLFASNPKLKKIPFVRRQNEAPADSILEGVLICDMETDNSVGVAGE